MMSRNLNLKSLLVNATTFAKTDVSAGEVNERLGTSFSSPSAETLASGTYSGPPAAGARATLGLGRPGEAAQIHEVRALVAEAVWLLTKTNWWKEGSTSVGEGRGGDARPSS